MLDSQPPPKQTEKNSLVTLSFWTGKPVDQHAGVIPPFSRLLALPNYQIRSQPSPKSCSAARPLRQGDQVIHATDSSVVICRGTLGRHHDRLLPSRLNPRSYPMPHLSRALGVAHTAIMLLSSSFMHKVSLPGVRVNTIMNGAVSNLGRWEYPCYTSSLFNHFTERSEMI